MELIENFKHFENPARPSWGQYLSSFVISPYWKVIQCNYTLVKVDGMEIISNFSLVIDNGYKSKTIPVTLTLPLLDYKEFVNNYETKVITYNTLRNSHPGNNYLDYIDGIIHYKIEKNKTLTDSLNLLLK